MRRKVIFIKPNGHTKDSLEYDVRDENETLNELRRNGNTILAFENV